MLHPRYNHGKAMVTSPFFGGGGSWGVPGHGPGGAHHGGGLRLLRHSAAGAGAAPGQADAAADAADGARDNKAMEERWGGYINMEKLEKRESQWQEDLRLKFGHAMKCMLLWKSFEVEYGRG